MRKVYLAALSLVTGLFAFGQTETIVAHTAPSMLSFPNGSFTIFSNASGYLSGTANLGIPTEGIVQKFDMSTGIQANGTIDAVRMWIPVKADAGNGTTVDVVLYEDNGGVPGTVIASQTVSIANIDTAVLSTNILNDGVNATGAYNLEVTFAGANIPSNMTFWAGLDLTNTGNGDTVAIMTTIPTDAGFGGGTADFALSSTHTGAIAFGQFLSFTTAVADAAFLPALYIHPVVTYTNLGVDEPKAAYTVNAYPNPASDVVRIDLPDSRTRTISVISLTGQILKTIAVNNASVTMNISDLESGVYMYQLQDDNGSVLTTNKLVVRK